MDFNFLPKEPEKRTAILLLPREDVKRLQYESEGSEFIENAEDKQVHLLDVSTTDSHPIIQRIRGSGFLKPRSLLIQSPYNPSDYAPVLDAPYTFAQAKCFHFSTFCALLGARKVFVEQMDVQTTEGKTKFSGSLDTSYGKGSTELERRAWERMRKEIKLEQEFEGGEPNLEKAKDYLFKYRLLSNTSMTHLLDQWSETVNKIKNLKFSLSVSTESKRNLEGVLSLKIPMSLNLLEGQSEIEQTKKEFLLFSVTIKVEF